VNYFVASPKFLADFRIPAEGTTTRVIAALDGQLITAERHLPATVCHGELQADPSRDILKLTVVNRYDDAPPSLALVQGFGLKQGAIASSVAHDSHNIVAVGTTDEALCRAVNAVIQAQGGIAVADTNRVEVLPLPIAGLMSAEDGYQVAKQYAQLDADARKLGSMLSAPLMTLSFMALLVMPALKLSDRGLFDGAQFHFVSLWVE
jgi:adenine deaminase